MKRLEHKFKMCFPVILIIVLLFIEVQWGFSSDNNSLIFQPPPPPEISGGAAMARMRNFQQSINTSKTLDFPLNKSFDMTAHLSLITFEGINFDQDGSNNANRYHLPPDPIGASGPNHVVSVVNTSIEWFTKAGVKENSQSLSSFFSSSSPLTDTFDPKVIYDQYANRFLVVTLEVTDTTQGDTANTSRILLAVSDDNDPNGTWYFHSENSIISINNADHWADYPGFAVDDETIYIENNMFTFGTSPSNDGSRLWIVEKGNGSGGFYDGGAATVSVHDPYSSAGFPGTTQPAHMFGTGPTNVGTFLVGYSGVTTGGPGGLEAVQVIRVDNPLTSPTFTHQFVTIGDIEDVGGSFGFPPLIDASQLGTSQTVEVNDRRTLNAVWRNNTLWITTTITPNAGPDSGQTTAHWWKLNTTNLTSIALSDQGNIGGEDIAPTTFTFFPSLAVNMNGDMAIGFAACGDSIYPGAYYTGRLNNDPPGTTQAAGTLRAGQEYYFRAFGGTRNRWGDYSGLSVDPSDDLTFWVFNEYALTRGTILPQFPTEDGRWGTAWASFTLPFQPVLIDPGVDVTNIPDIYELHQNYPNPFNPNTQIQFGLPTASHVTIEVYNNLGQKVTTLLDENRPAGQHEITFDGKNFPSGVYLYHLKAEGVSMVRKMIMMK